MMFSYDVICSSMMMMMIIIYEKRSFFSHAYVEIMSCMCLCDIRIIGEKILGYSYVWKKVRNMRKMMMDIFYDK